jgi:hypothetical protein
VVVLGGATAFGWWGSPPVTVDSPGRLLQRREKQEKVGYETRSRERGGCAWRRLQWGWRVSGANERTKGAREWEGGREE